MPDSRLIVALDVPDALAGLALAQKLGNQVGFYKIGGQLGKNFGRLYARQFSLD